MTSLEKAAKEHPVMTREIVHHLWGSDRVEMPVVESLCESHERLRLELETAMCVSEERRLIIDEHAEMARAGVAWRPIADADKAADKLLLWVPVDEGAVFGYWCDETWLWRDEDECVIEPTHFAIVQGPEGKS